VTVHNFAGFVHVARALEKVLPSDACVWFAGLEEIFIGAIISKSSEAEAVKIENKKQAEAEFEKNAWSAAIQRFDVAGEHQRLLRMPQHEQPDDKIELNSLTL
jgi:hypothetical protein